MDQPNGELRGIGWKGCDGGLGQVCGRGLEGGMEGGEAREERRGEEREAYTNRLLWGLGNMRDRGETRWRAAEDKQSRLFNSISGF